MSTIVTSPVTATHHWVITTLQNLWLQGRTCHRSPSGWLSGNAPCCQHRGHRADTRGRGGMLVQAHQVVYSCFNCHFATGYTAGHQITPGMRRLLHWLGATDSLVSELTLAALRDLGEDTPLIPEPQWQQVRRELPGGSEPLDPCRHPEHWQYICNRGIDPSNRDFWVSSNTRLNMHRRVIVPFRWNDQLIGYIARAIDDSSPRYYKSQGMPFVLGLDWQRRDWSWCPVAEGVFDALSIDGCATLGNQVNDTQAAMLDSLGKTLVVVPDRDSAGRQLIQAALDYDWQVSFPEWPSNCKDINDAVRKLGKLYVLRHIWATREQGRTAIAVRMARWHKTKKN